MSLREPVSLPAPSSSVHGHILLSLSQISVPFSSTHTLISCFSPAPHRLALHTAYRCSGHSRMQVRSQNLVWPQLLMVSRYHSSLLTKEYKVLWVFFFFLAAVGLHCCTWSFSSCRARGLLSRLLVWASPCSGFSLRSRGSRQAGFRG